MEPQLCVYNAGRCSTHWRLKPCKTSPPPMNQPDDVRLVPQVFISPFCVKKALLRSKSRNKCAARARTSPSMVVDPVSVGTGYAFLNSLKGVVIGPTINEITAAVAGGTVGVMGTIIALETRRQRVKERKQCPYCRGTGKLPCATCYTVGALPCGSTLTAQVPCQACQERGFLQCNHCEGDGRLIPWRYERAIRAQYEDYVYTAVDDYYQDEPPYI